MKQAKNVGLILLFALLALGANNPGTSTTATIAPAKPIRAAESKPPKPPKKKPTVAVEEPKVETAPEKKAEESAVVYGPIERKFLPTLPEAAPTNFEKVVDAIQEMPESPVFNLGLLLFLAFLSWAAGRGSRFIYSQLRPVGLLPTIFRLLTLACRVLAIVFILAAIVVSLPKPLTTYHLVIIAAVVAILLWSARDLLPDLIAGGVITVERRIHPGVWVSGEGFAGVVEWVGLRAVWLRDTSGRRVSVPNRALLKGPVASDGSRWPTREISVCFSIDDSADQVRAALYDATLTSPWTPIEPSPTIRRDAADPNKWHVRTRLLDSKYVAQFEGELVERAEEILAARP